MIVLVSSDQVLFRTEMSAVARSTVLGNLLEDVGESSDPIPIPNVDSRVLCKIVEYCERLCQEPPASGPRIVISDWEQAFLDINQTMLFDLILAANYLEIKRLIDITCKTVADMIQDKTPAEIRHLFDIPYDFTPEEEAQIQKEQNWAADSAP